MGEQCHSWYSGRVVLKICWSIEKKKKLCKKKLVRGMETVKPSKSSLKGFFRFVFIFSLELDRTPYI